MRLIRKLLIALTLVMAFGYALNTINTRIANAKTVSACTDECEADFLAARYTCNHSGLTPQQAIQCYNDAKANYNLCIAGCQ